LCFSSGKFIDKNFVDKIKEAKLACHIWTVDHVADARQFIDAGVDGIISNRPHWLKSQLGII
jgi:glycerophosphoryl diester phosphodiesterase